MSELTKTEIWVIQVAFSRRLGAYRINDVFYQLKHLAFAQGDKVIDSLIRKKVFSLSPDGESVKFTDYGVELYDAHLKDQAEWESQQIINIATSDRDQIVIREGETFTGNRVIREILAQVRKDIAIIDTYVGAPLFDLLESLSKKVTIRVLTLTKVLESGSASKNAMLAYKAFKTQYPRAEMRTITKLHDRYILWDRIHGFHLGGSIKDLGKKDTQLNRLTPADPQWTLFEERWAEATPIP